MVTPRVAASVVLGIALATAATARADRVVDGYTGFRSPSGNIGCMIDPSSVRCDITDRVWAPPPRPSDCPSATGYGQGIAIVPGEEAEFVCAGDTAFSNADPLAYGESITAGLLRCSSAESGMTCTDTSTGHGFTLARERYRLF